MVYFLRQDPVRYKMVVDKKCLKRIGEFQYFGCKICYENELDRYSTKTGKIFSILEFLIIF